MKEMKTTVAHKAHHQAVAQYVDNARRFPRIRLFFWLLRCNDAVDKFANAEVSKKGDNRTGLTVLQILLEHPDGISQQSIAEQTGRTKQAIVVAIDKLVKKGHVIRCSDDNDRRINSIRITKEGLDHLAEVFPHTINMCNNALSSLSDSEIDELLPLVVKLTNSLRNE
jgi:DNA-binding MarR family transcriptional regulator